MRKTVRLGWFAPLLLLAACVAEPPPPADPATLALNAREHAKLVDFASCQVLAQEEARGSYGEPPFRSFVDECMESKGYLRSQSPSYPVAGN